MLCVCEAEDRLLGSVLPFHLYVGSGARTHVAKLVWQASLPAKPSHWPHFYSFNAPAPNHLPLCVF